MQNVNKKNNNMGHEAVLVKEVIDNLAIKPDGFYVDATFGCGGHSKEILARLGDKGRLLVIDKDAAAIKIAQGFDDERMIIRHGSFTQLRQWLEELGWHGKVDGILLDLGVSSPQLDNAERGFSFMHDGPLDMRMDVRQKISAADLVNTASVEKLADIFYSFGEERYAKRIARAVAEEREHEPILTTARLAEIVKRAHPRWEKSKHPATRVFLALRIAVNNELDEVKEVLEQSLEVLSSKGRLSVIAFHSLEDRLVKEFMHKHASGSAVPAGVPIRHEELPLRFKRIGKAVRASAEEVKRNPRSRSAILRTVEKMK